MKRSGMLPKAFRIFIIFFGALLLYLGGSNFYRYASSPNDENWFTDPKSNLYIIEGFPATQFKSGKADKHKVVRKDSICVGDILLAVEGKYVKKADFAREILVGIPSDSTLWMRVHRLTENKYHIYLVQKSALPDSFFRELPPTAYVFDVFKDGASDRAGMQKGDLIYSINGKTFDNMYGADKLLQQTRPGETIEYKVIRKNRLVTLYVKIARFGFRLPVLIILACGLIFIGVGLFIGVKRPQFTATRLLSLGLMLFGFSMGVIYKRDLHQDEFVMLRDLLTLFAMNIGIPIWLHSSYYFPGKRFDFANRRWLPYPPYVIGAIAFILFLTHRVKADGSTWLIIALMFLYHFAVGFIFRKHIRQEHKKLSRVIKWTLGLAFVGALALGYIIVQFGNRVQIGYIGLFLIHIPFAYLHSIGRYQLFDLHLRIRKNIQYTFISMFWYTAVVGAVLMALIYVAHLHIDLPNIRFIGTSIEVTDSPLFEKQSEVLRDLLYMFMAIAITYTAWKLSLLGKKFIDARYYQTRYDYRRAANVLSEVMATKLTPEELARGIVEKLTQLMKLNRGGIVFFRDESTCCCREASGLDAGEWQELCLKSEVDLMQALRAMPASPRLDVEHLPAPLRTSLMQQDFRLVVPIRFKNKLMGALLIGDKLSESPFHQEDHLVLDAVAKQASVAIENAFLYEHLAEQERLKHELEIARRIQLGSLPQSTPDVKGLEISGISVPATEVGGDYYDYLNGEPDSLTVVVGDVSGKGTSAALYMAKIQGILRSLHAFNLSPREIFIRANQLLSRDLEKQSFVTALGADFHPGEHKLLLARAGHLPLLHFCAEKQQVLQLTPAGLGIGLDTAGAFASTMEEATIYYAPGDVFLFVTDGITEAHDAEGDEFGEAKLADVLRQHAHHRADRLRDVIMNAVQEFSGNDHQHDDQTVVVVRALG